MPRPRSFDEDHVLELVRQRFWDTGYAATSLDDLMTATGLAKGSLYGAFGDKHTLF
jgi:TetR/AcrR family transcriptional repressor of nem operon